MNADLLGDGLLLDKEQVVVAFSLYISSEPSSLMALFWLIDDLKVISLT